jgi:hypothetical protein
MRARRSATWSRDLRHRHDAGEQDQRLARSMGLAETDALRDDRVGGVTRSSRSARARSANSARPNLRPRACARATRPSARRPRIVGCRKALEHRGQDSDGAIQLINGAMPRPSAAWIERPPTGPVLAVDGDRFVPVPLGHYKSALSFGCGGAFGTAARSRILGHRQRAGRRAPGRASAGFAARSAAARSLVPGPPPPRPPLPRGRFPRVSSASPGARSPRRPALSARRQCRSDRAWRGP